MFIVFNINHSSILPLMALNSLYCADVLLSNYSLIHSLLHVDSRTFRVWTTLGVLASEGWWQAWWPCPRGATRSLESTKMTMEDPKTSRVKISGGLGGGLDPHWKASNPHCKHRIKKLGGRVSTPLALIPVNPHIEIPSSITCLT